jgi:arylsulfatase
MAETVQREVLPIPDRNPVTLTTYDARDPDTSFPPIEPLRPPAGAPNVLVVLLDDVGPDAEDADHLITPEEMLRVAMARH